MIPSDIPPTTINTTLPTTLTKYSTTTTTLSLPKPFILNNHRSITGSIESDDYKQPKVPPLQKESQQQSQIKKKSKRIGSISRSSKNSSSSKSRSRSSSKNKYNTSENNSNKSNETENKNNNNRIDVAINKENNNINNNKATENNNNKSNSTTLKENNNNEDGTGICKNNNINNNSKNNNTKKKSNDNTEKEKENDTVSKDIENSNSKENKENKEKDTRSQKDVHNIIEDFVKYGVSNISKIHEFLREQKEDKNKDENEDDVFGTREYLFNKYDPNDPNNVYRSKSSKPTTAASTNKITINNSTHTNSSNTNTTPYKNNTNNFKKQHHAESSYSPYKPPTPSPPLQPQTKNQSSLLSQQYTKSTSPYTQNEEPPLVVVQQPSNNNSNNTTKTTTTTTIPQTSNNNTAVQQTPQASQEQQQQQPTTTSVIPPGFSKIGEILKPSSDSNQTFYLFEKREFERHFTSTPLPTPLSTPVPTPLSTPTKDNTSINNNNNVNGGLFSPPSTPYKAAQSPFNSSVHNIPNTNFCHTPPSTNINHRSLRSRNGIDGIVSRSNNNMNIDTDNSITNNRNYSSGSSRNKHNNHNYYFNKDEINTNGKRPFEEEAPSTVHEGDNYVNKKIKEEQVFGYLVTKQGLIYKILSKLFSMGSSLKCDFQFVDENNRRIWAFLKTDKNGVVKIQTNNLHPVRVNGEHIDHDRSRVLNHGDVIGMLSYKFEFRDKSKCDTRGFLLKPYLHNKKPLDSDRNSVGNSSVVTLSAHDSTSNNNSTTTTTTSTTATDYLSSQSSSVVKCKTPGQLMKERIKSNIRPRKFTPLPLNTLPESAPQLFIPNFGKVKPTVKTQTLIPFTRSSPLKLSLLNSSMITTPVTRKSNLSSPSTLSSIKKQPVVSILEFPIETTIPVLKKLKSSPRESIIREPIIDGSKSASYPWLIGKTFMFDKSIKDPSSLKGIIESNKAFVNEDKESSLGVFRGYVVVSKDNLFFPRYPYKVISRKFHIVNEESIHNGKMELMHDIFPRLPQRTKASIYPCLEDLSDEIKIELENDRFIKDSLGHGIKAVDFYMDLQKELSGECLEVVNYKMVRRRSKVHFVLCLVEPSAEKFNSSNFGTLVTLKWLFDCLKHNRFIDPKDHSDYTFEK